MTTNHSLLSILNCPGCRTEAGLEARRRAELGHQELPDIAGGADWLNETVSTCGASILLAMDYG